MSFAIFDSVYQASSVSLTTLEGQIKRLANEISKNAGTLSASDDGLNALHAKDTDGNGTLDASELGITPADPAAGATAEELYNARHDINGDGKITDQEVTDMAAFTAGKTVSTAPDGDSTSVDMLALQKYVGEWTVLLGLSTGLLKSLSDGLQGVTRNI